MGLFKELALLPLAPVRGTLWVTEQIVQEAEAQLYDEDRIKRELIQLEFEEQAGRITKKEREEIERDLFERLAIARQRAAEQVEAPMTSHSEAEYEVIEDG
jgi:hypothetical protein